MSDSNIEHDDAVARLSLLLERRRLASARDVLGQALPRYPESVALLQYAAWIDWMDDRLDDAEESIARILELEPKSYEARRLRVEISDEKNHYADAEAQVLDLLREYPDDAGLYALYARVMLHTFNIDKAERLVQEALRRDPDNSEALNIHVLCGFIAAPGPEQRQRLQVLLQKNPDQLTTIIRLIQLLADEGRNREAYELARELVQAQPDNEGIVELAESLKLASHWSLKPLWPMQKWGWGGSIAIWFLAVALFSGNLLQSTPLAPYENEIALVFIAYVIYSWVWPPILKRLLGLRYV